MKSVAILGCGPAGLMVAHAATLSGWDFRIYSRKQKSALYGSQYLHAAIPGLDTGTPHTVRYRLEGTAEQYRHKVYGDTWDGTVSPEDFMEQHYAWDLRDAYDRMWDHYSQSIWDLDVRHKPGSALLQTWQALPGGHDLVISTIPRKVWAQPGDVFESTKVFALGDTEMPRVEKPYRPEPFTVNCDGRPHVPWYRVSNIYGYCTIEWPWNNYDFGFKPTPHPGASVVEKPLSHNSTAASDFIHLGRYGKWEKGVLTSDAFFDAMKVFADDSIQKGLV
jgi:hypothetical protein